MKTKVKTEERSQMLRLGKSGMVKGPTFALAPAYLKIDGTTFLPIVVLEAAQQYARALKEHGWALRDLNGMPIDASRMKMEICP